MDYTKTIEEYPTEEGTLHLRDIVDRNLAKQARIEQYK